MSERFSYMMEMFLRDAAALVLTLCCGARWNSCCSSSRLLLFSLPLKTTSVQSVLHTHALPWHSSKALLVFLFNSRLLCLETGLLSLPFLAWSWGTFQGVFWRLICLVVVCWYVGFLQLCSPTASSLHYPELSVELIGSLFSFPHAASNSSSVVMKS